MSATPATPPQFSIRAVAALFIARQHLVRPRSRRLSAARLTRFAEDVGGIQLDSINVVDRAHHLTLWSRFGPYDRKALERLVYRRRMLFEYWAHAACMVPIAHFSAWRRAMLDYSTRSRGWAAWLKKNGKVLREVEAAIRERGVLGNADFIDKRGRGGAGWWNWKPAAHALDYLWMSGRTAVHSRVHFQKRFDLTERVLPAVHATAALPREEFLLWHVRRSLHAMGAATWADLRLYLTFPRMSIAERRRTLHALLASGEVVEVAVKDDSAKWYALAADLDALAKAGRKRSVARGSTLLAPFDSFLWHRARTRRLFGFDYRIEVYTPGHKRTHGYYSLPIFHDGQILGRVDPKTHREAKWLEVKHAHFEPWFVDGGTPPAASWGRIGLEDGLRGTAEAIRSLAEFVGAERITIGRVTPARLAAPLRRALAGKSGTGATEPPVMEEISS